MSEAEILPARAVSQAPRPDDPEFAARGKPARTSAIVQRLADEWTGETISLGDIMHALRDRSFGVLMILFAMPNAVIPGLSAILGTPIIIFAVQMVCGLREPWLPPVFLRRSMPIAQFRIVAARVVKFLIWLERFLRPRLSVLTSAPAERVLGVYLVAVAVVLAMPIPWGNPLPAFSISFIAAGLMEEDGVAVIAGVLLGIAGTVYVAGAIGAAAYAATALLQWIGL